MGSSQSKRKDEDYIVNRVEKVGDSKLYSVAAVECESDLIRFFTVSQNGHLSVHKAAKERLRKSRCRVQLESTDSLESAWRMSVAVSPSCKYYAEGGLNCCVSLWDFASHGKVGEEYVAEGYITHISFVTDNFIVYSSGDGNVYFSEIIEDIKGSATHSVSFLKLAVAAADVLTVATHCMDDSSSVLCAFAGSDNLVYGLYLDSWLRQTERGSGKLRRRQRERVEVATEDFNAALSFGKADCDVNSVSISTGNNARFVAICGDDFMLRVFQRGADTRIRNSAGDLLKHPSFNPLAAVSSDDCFLRSCDWVSATRVVCVGDCQSLKSPNIVHVLDLVEPSVDHFGLAVELLTDGFMHGLAETFVEFVASNILSFLPLIQKRHWQLPLGTKGSTLSCVSRCCQNGFAVCSWDKSLCICVLKHQ